MNCEECDRLVLDYVEGELRRLESLRFWWHLRRCRPCRGYVDQYRRTIGLVRGAFPDDCAVSPPRDPRAEPAAAECAAPRGRDAGGSSPR
jgi:predicted anti-sigma-YlaC factor YlaD